jgi:guanine nucleotide-binding protein G(I)/G(S)/G(T) subunit beta-1
MSLLFAIGLGWSVLSFHLFRSLAQILSASTSLAFSSTGHVLFAANEDYNCHLWCTQTAERINALQSHANRVSAVMTSPDGKAVATGSWDTIIKIWA